MAYVPNADNSAAPTVGEKVATAPGDFQVIKAKLLKTLLTPEAGGLLLQSVAERAGRIWVFDAGGGQTSIPVGGEGDPGLRSDLADGDFGFGAALVAFKQLETGGMQLSVNTKLQKMLHVVDFGLAADGVTGDADKLIAAVNASAALGVALEFDKDSVIALEKQVPIPDNAILHTNGCKFIDKLGTISNTALFTVGNNVEINRLEIEIPAGIQRDRVAVIGENFQSYSLRVNSINQQANNTDTEDVALKFLNSHKSHITWLTVEGYDRPIKIDNTDTMTVECYMSRRYVRSCWILDSKHIKINSGNHDVLSVNAGVTAGNNVFLVGSNTVDASYDLLIRGQDIAVAGEHAIRVGGPETIRNVRIEDCNIRNCGRSGIKFRGSDGVTINYNYNFKVSGCVIEDVGSSDGAADNCCGVLAEFVAGLKISDTVVRTRANTYSAHYGFFINACNDVNLSGCSAKNAKSDTLIVYAKEADVSRVEVSGGIFHAALRNGIRLQTAATFTARNVHFKGCMVQGCTDVGWQLSNGGSLTDIVVDINTHSTTGGAISCNSNAVRFCGRGLPGAVALATVSALDGSTWSDNTTLWVRKGGAWVDTSL